MTTPNLPPLAGATVALPASRGEWVSKNVNLDRLADSLALPAEGLEARDLKSIPDVWAQVLVFQNALTQENHPLRADAIRDWRALLTLFALSEAYAREYRLELQGLDLAAGERGPGDLFRRVLLRLKPNVSLPQTLGSDTNARALADWARPVLVFVRERTGGPDDAPLFGPPQLAGLLNPATLVATGKTSPALHVRTAPWLAGGLADPSKLDPARSLPRRDYAILTRYLDDLQSSLASVAGGADASPLYDSLIGQLAAFAAECRLRAEGYDRELAAARTPVGSADLPELYRALGRSYALAQSAFPVGYSETKIALREDFVADGARPFEALILIDPAIADTRRRRPQDIHVWREHTLKTVGESPGLLAQVRREAIDAGYLIVTPDDFFTPEFVRLGARGVVDGHPANSDFRSAVLPLSPLALLAHAPDALMGALELQNLGDGGQTVRLKLTVAGADAPHYVSRTYRPDGYAVGAGLAERALWQIGVISTWPDFQHDSWRWNFLRLAYNPQTTAVRPRFGVSARQLARAFAVETGRAARAARAETWLRTDVCAAEEAEFQGRVTPEQVGQAAPAFQRLRHLQTEDAVEELHISASAFEAVCLARSRAIGEPAKPVGMVLLTRNVLANPPPSAPVVAVDFGTTNTVACLDDRRAVVFRDRVKFPIFQPEEDAENRRLVKWSYLDFFPLAEAATPLPTVAKHREVNAGRDIGLTRVSSGEDDRPLFSDLIYFQPPSAEPQLNQTDEDIARFGESKAHLEFNLKWGRDPVTRRVARRFLRQFMLMTSAELLASGRDPRRARWRFSYPEAMSPTDQSDLRENLERAWLDLFTRVEDGEPAPIPSNHPIRPLTSEGAASAKYFQNFQGPNGQFAGPLTLILDIGGGTTDIAVLGHGEPLWRGSFRLAGGDFVTHYLMNHPEFFEAIGLADLAKLRRSFSDQTSTLYPSDDHDNRLKFFGELLFSNRRFSDRMRLNYSEVAGSDVGRGLRHSAWVYLGGMVFYMGGIVRHLLDEGRITEEDVRRLSFGLGGRGATFFKRYEGDGGASPLNALLGTFVHGAGLDPARFPHRSVLTSPEAKLEVVLGMVGDSEDDRAQLARLSAPPLYSMTPLGETIRVGDRALDPDTATAALTGGAGLQYPELDGLNRFLAAMGAEAQLEVDLMPERHNGAGAFIRDRVFKTLRQQADDRARMVDAGREKQAPAIEPPFITGLRALLDRLGRPAEERRGYVAVRDL